MFKSGTNATSSKNKPYIIYKMIDELILPASKLKFTKNQLLNLNYLFQSRFTAVDTNLHIENEKSIELARSVTERLIQRLVCCAGLIDDRFASKFLIPLHNNDNTNTLQYLLRLDQLSKPSLYSNDVFSNFSVIENDSDTPKGYARIRMFSNLYKTWGEFANNQGYLRRDKIQAKFVELLAQAAASDVPNAPNILDESKFCASPGKIIDALTLRNILKIPCEEHVYFGASGKNPRFPDPRDFRLAIVDEPSGIRLRVEFISPAFNSLSIDVRILIGIEVDAWPSIADFPERIPLAHADSLLYQTVAQTGVYLVGYGVQSSAWQMRFPAAEAMLLNNYSNNSTVHAILDNTSNILQDLYEEQSKLQMIDNILNRYIMKTVLFFELEKDTSIPTTVLINWAPHTLSKHILKILDNLITGLRNQRVPNYFFTSVNLLANPGHLCEDDYMIEARNIQRIIMKFYDQSLVGLEGQVGFDQMMFSQDFELTLLCKWKEIVDGLIPPSATRGRRFCFAGSSREVAHSQYTPRQLEYIGILLKNVLKVRQNILQPMDDTWEDYPPEKDTCAEADARTEDIIYVLVIIIEQAKQMYMNTIKAKMRQRLLNNEQFDGTLLKLIDLVRKEHQVIENDFEFVTCILKWLYRALDQSHKLLAPMLRPYLSILFVSSHGISWFVEDIKKRMSRSDESLALGAFAKLVNNGTITPAQGLVDCVNKNWGWAKNMLELVEKEHLRLIFVKGRERIGRHVLFVPVQMRKTNAFKIMELEETKAFSTLPRKSYFGSIFESKSIKEKPVHCILKEASTMTQLGQSIHRLGDHRCAGDILQTLISMQKHNILQDISAILPHEDRVLLLESVQKISNEKKRNTIKKYSQKLIMSGQKYTKKEESAGIILDSDATRSGQKQVLVLNKSDLNKELGDSLMGSCRAARIKHSESFNGLDHLKMKALVRKTESFKNN